MIQENFSKFNIELLLSLVCFTLQYICIKKNIKHSLLIVHLVNKVLLHIYVKASETRNIKADCINY